MDHKQIINQRQLAWLTSSIVTSGGIISLQNILFRVNEMDAWFCYLLPVLYIFLVAAFFAAISRLFPRKNIFEIAILLLGRTGGTIVILVLLFHFWMIVVRDISTFSRFSSTILLDNTPLEILILLPCLILIYYGKSSFEIIARVNDVFYPLFVLSILLMPLLLTNEMSMRMLTPVLTGSPWNMLSGSFLAVGGAGDIFVIGAFMHMVFNSNQIRSSIRHGMLLGIILLTIVTLLEAIVLGPKIPGNFLYPSYNLVQMIHVTDFLDRLDIILLTIWYPTIICKIVAIYMALLLGLSSIFKNRDHTVFNKPVALWIAITTLTSFKSTTEIFAFANFSSPLIVLGYQPLVMALLYVIARMKYRKKGASTLSIESHSMKVELQGPVKYLRLLWLGNLLMLAALGFIVIGLMFSKYIPLIGDICAVCYFLCLFLTTFSTHMEINKLKKVNSSAPT
jgi:spore germination protein KB